MGHEHAQERSGHKEGPKLGSSFSHKTMKQQRLVCFIERKSLYLFDNSPKVKAEKEAGRGATATLS